MKLLLKLENIGLLLISLLLFDQMDYSWWAYILFFFAPDISAIGYLVNEKIGAYSYNLLHNIATAGILIVLGYIIDLRIIEFAGIIILGHIGLDRVLGFGLKYKGGFKKTHLSKLA
ncbi:MAG TPA: DUF4260 domain-containing protein [Candidatus Dojkabacteria bacterium]|jgi:hypothetical protein